MKQASGWALLLTGLVFATPFLWAQGNISNASRSNASHPAGKKDASKMAGMYAETAACARLTPTQAEPAASVPAGEKMVVGHGAAPASVKSSSSLAASAGPDKLFDAPSVPTYWHIDPSKRLRAEWLVIELNSKRRSPVNYIRVIPRSDSPTQIFTTACLEGGNDGKQWRAIANLSLPESQKAAKWFGWKVPPTESYRYFKFLIPNNLPEQNRTFYSIGKLEMYQ